ncbi:MAG TPA: glycosyltransferase family 1 protein [Vicinamibacterales bacterium]|nr:glycosyltransferase family 1 protein [Vicinamibacterales bacterium]
MKVAILTDNDFGKVNGVTTTLRAVIRHAPEDVEPHVYTFADAAADTDGYTALASRGVAIPFYGEMRMYAPRLAALRQRLVADRVCAIHLTTPGPAGLAARQISRSLGLPLIGSYHTELGEYTARLSGSRRLGALMQQYMRWIYGGCQHVLVPSDVTRQHLVATGWNARRLGVWGRGVDSQCFSPARRSEALRRAWQVSDRRPAILYAGRLSREKGLGLLPELRRLLHDHHIPHRFILAGDGPMARELHAALPDAAFTGTLTHDAMGAVMASCDLFVFPSETDTAGNVVLEAQAAGLPVLVTDLGGPRENMQDRLTGYVCRAGSERDFCWRVAELLVDPDRRARMSEAARAYAVTRGWSGSLQPLFDCYRSTLRTASAQSTARVSAPPRAAAHV